MAISISKAIEAVKQTNGNVTRAALALGCSRVHLYRIIGNSPKLKEAIEEAREVKLDNLEDEAYNQAMSGNTALLIFLLKTMGKSRGYVERQEMQHDGNGITITVKREHRD